VEADVMLETSPVFGFGAVFYADKEGEYAAIDFHTGERLWTVEGIPTGGLETPVLCGGILYLATDDGHLYAASPVSGALLWSNPVEFAGAPLTAPVPGLGYIESDGRQGAVVYLMDEYHVYLVPASSPDRTPPAPRTVFSTAGALTLGVGMAYDGASGHMVVNTSRGLMALDANRASADPWSVAWKTDLGGYVTAATLAMGRAFVGTPAQTMTILDAAGGGQISSAALGSNIEQPVSVDASRGVAYAPTASGTIFQLDATSAKRITSFQPGTQVTTPIAQADGVAYYGSADKHIYAFDLADTSHVVSLEVADPVTYLAGVSSGTTYFGTISELHAGEFADLIHQFNSQSQLLVDFLGTQQASSFQQAPAYQSDIVLYDPQGNVRPRESVKLWASAPVMLMTDNQSFKIDSATPASFQSDASGHIHLSVQADTNISASVPSGLSTPALTLWASFMEPDERILIFADQRLHASLQAITGPQLQAATSYNHADPGQLGPALLPAGFQGPAGLANANALASAINNTIALQPPNDRLAADGDPPYLAYPQTMLGVSYAPRPPDTSRAAHPGTIPNWKLSLSGASGATFTPYKSAEEAARAADALHRARLDAGSLPGSIFDDIGHFVDNVINGVEKVAETVWQATAEAINVVIHTAENEYRFVVHTIEDAAHVVLGFLKSVIDDVENAIEKIIEALGFLFDWGAILATHRQIKALVNAGFGKMSTFVGALESGSDAFFESLANTIVADFQRVIGKLAGQGALGEAAGSTDPNRTYTTNGSDNYSVQGNWMYHKAITGALGTNGQVLMGHSTLSAPAGADPAAIVAQEMLLFIENVGKDALAVAEDLEQTVAVAMKELVKVLVKPGGAQGAKLADLLAELQNLLVDLVTLAKDAAHDFFGLLVAVIDAVKELLNATIEIPFVSWLYKLIAGDELSILDLFALIVAIPVTVMCKALTGKAPFGSGETEALGEPARAESGDLVHTAQLVALPGAALAPTGGELNISNMIWTLNGIIYALIDCLSNAMADESPPLIAYGLALSEAISQALTIPLDTTPDEAAPWEMLWVYQCFPTLWSVYCGVQTSTGRQTSNAVMPAWGIGSAIWQAIYAGVYPEEFFDDGVKLLQNEAGALSAIAEFARESEDPLVLAGLILVDYFLDIVNALLEIKYWWV
jgi:outer membrane protein assembly factor BamB